MFEDINHDRRRVLGVAAMAVAAAPLALIGAQTFLDAVRIPAALPPLGRATQWLNSPPLTVAGLRGKVVLIDFWTYTCINWLRTLPYVRAWADKYAERGLVVIGVHTPEFDIERDIDGVRRATRYLRVDYPVAIDNDYAIWNAFGNSAWPALYLVDAKGRIRHHQIGEGRYERAEMWIQQLLAEAGSGDVDRGLVSVEASGVEIDAAWGSLRSGEQYVGYERADHFASPGGARRDKRRTYAIPAGLSLNQWALAGDWTIERQAAIPQTADGRMACRFHARDLHLVLARPLHGRPARFRIQIDGAPPGADHGVDVDATGWGSVREDRLYQLVRQAGPVAARTFEIEFADAGVRAYAFTFG